MWSVNNKTAYAAAGGWIRDLDGTEVWVVAVKATYDILPGGELRIAAEQVPVHRAAVPTSAQSTITVLPLPCA